MFKIESYVTPILLSYVDKYVRDFNPADAQVSLWGGGVALHNLVLKADVLQQEMALPFTLVSGRIHELLIQVPWTKIMSEPIIVTIDTIECILSLRPPADVAENSTPDLPSRRPQVVEAPPGYMQALVRRIVSNIALRVHHLIVKYAQDDVVLSLNVKHLAVDSAAATWEPAFADIDPGNPVIRRTVRLDDLTLCLDRSDSDGKIRYYQEPLLYRCQLDLRVLTRLVSASTRRARSVSVALRSSKLAWGVTDEQLLLLLRLLRERPAYEPGAPPPAAPKPTTANQASQIHSLTSTSAEPVRSESWSEWAWSWLPALEERAGGAEEAPAPLAPTPVYFAAYLDRVAVVFKVMESDSNNRKRARGVLELCATHAAVKASSCAPSTLRARCGLRDVQLRAHGKCVCGYYDTGIDNEDATMFLSRMENVVEEWNWPEDTDDQAVETAEVADEEYRETQESGESTVEGAASAEQPAPEQKESVGDTDGLWREMAPAVYLEFAHDRAPPDVYTNPYDNPPTDFEYRVLMGLPRHCSASGMFAESRVDCFYTTMRKRCTSLARRLRASPNTILSVFAHSDWVEDCSLSVVFKPMMIKVSTSLLHRLDVIRNVFKDLPPVVVAETPMRTLTVEECDYLLNNLPQRRVCVRAEGLRVRVLPAAHAPPDRAAAAQPPPPLVLDVDVPAVDVAAIAPLYPLRVCQAACQIPDESGALWQGARLHVTATVSSLEARISTVGGEQPRPCARADLRLVLHSMLRREYFTRRESVLFSYSAKIQEVSVCGSAARLQAAWRVLQSLLHGRQAPQLRHSSLPKDALNDEESVAIDLTVENISARGYVTKNTNTHILLLQSSRATALHAPSGGETKQAWLYSAPDGSTSSPYLRAALQWCEQPHPNTVDYAGVWTEPVALCVDPLFIAWLAYKPQPRAFSESQIGMKGFSSQYMIRRRTTPPSSSGRGGSRSGSGAELVHAVRPRSLGSGSEPSDKKEQKQTLPQQPAATSLWDGSRLVRCYERLRRTLVAVELGLALVYVTMSTASALDCATVRDAMERHAATAQRVLTISLGRLSMSASSMPKNLWHEIRHDGPTFVQPKTDGMSTSDGDRFPWRVHLADVSCYTLEVHAPPQRAGRESAAPGPRSRLRMQCVTTPRTILELVTTTVTVSVVTKSLPVKTSTKKQDAKKTAAPHEDKTKYFTSGLDFKPTTLKEFVRGPARRRKLSENEGNQPQHEGRKSPEAGGAASGPVVSLGVHLHVDTPPVIVRLDQDQVVMVAVAAHCFTHILTLLQRESTPAPRHDYTSLGGSHRSLIRSVSEVDQLRSPTEDSESEKSELIPIFEAHSTVDTELKTSFWFQWVVSRATLIVAGSGVRLAFDADDVIATVDVQPHYNQLRVKVASAAVKHYVRSSETEEWRAGRLGGRVLEAREPANDKEDNHFLAVTVTQALISNLPASWKEELHPKLLQQRPSMDNMWEVYATVAPLEAVLQPDVLDQIVSLAREMAPRSFCPLQAEPVHSVSTWQWPFFYVNAGGLRLIITHEKHQKPDTDDTIVLSVGKVTVTPHPENPIFRRVITSGPESGWTTSAAGHYEGRQYEVVVRNVAVHSAMFKQLVSQEAGEVATGGENPALKWSRSHESPVLTPLLHAVDVSCVLAPPLAAGVAPACGPALELNLVSDCALELSVEQLRLLRCLAADVAHSFKHRIECGVYNDERHGVCPYATLLMHQMSMQEDCQSLSDTSFSEDACPYAVDSGVDTVTSHSTLKSSRTQEDLHPKKSVSVAFIEDHVDLSEYLEVFVTMGVVEVSLYAAQDGSVELGPLQPPRDSARRDPEPVVEEPSKSAQQLPEDPRDSPTAPKSLTDNIRTEGLGKIRFETYVRHQEGNLPLLHLKLHQPNLYYWKKKTQKHIQMSLFNLWLGLGGGEAGGWHAPLVTTARGACDPVTDIPPALATANVLLHAAAGAAYPSARAGSVRLEVERPVLFELSADRLVRLKAIADLITARTTLVPDSVHHADPSPIPLLYKLRRVLMHHNVESVTIETSQVGVCGVEGTAGWDAASLQVAAGARPDRVVARALLTALVAAAGPAGDRRHLLLHPLMIGAEIEATWEAWRRAEGGAAAREPTVCVRADLDRLTLDARPADLAALARLRAAVLDLIPLLKKSPLQQAGNDSMHPNLDVTHQPALRFDAHAPPRPAASATSFEADNDHYYKDDLRSGAFKLVSGGQLPMAYQVAAHGGAVAWRYPHPRAVTRLLAFPLPHLEEEVPCALEFFSKTLSRWEPHALFNLPVGEPRELKLNVAPPEAVFALTWRVRVVDGAASHPHPYVFSTQRFKPKAEPLVSEPLESEDEGATGVAGAAGAAGGGVSAQQLAGALRVDSYFAPRLLPRVRLVARLACLHLHLHNALPDLSRVAASLEGYYVSKPLLRSHRVLTLSARDTTAHAHLGSRAGALLLIDTSLASDMMECATGTMKRYVSETRAQAAVSVPRGVGAAGCGGGGYSVREARARLYADTVHVALHATRLRTAHALLSDWRGPIAELCGAPADGVRGERAGGSQREAAAAAAAQLEGRVSLWLHNTCSVALRVGQEGTDEIVPLGPGARLAYRWRCPVSPKKVRFALVGPETDWQWSNSVSFAVGACRVRLATASPQESEPRGPGAGVYLHVRVEEAGACRCMHLAGRLVLADMLRYNLLYKVRARCSDKQWRPVCSGELSAETVGRSVVCGADCDMVLKIKLNSHETGWSGDIPLKECPKENVPWLVKVPSKGDVPYVSVWCRVVRARSDGRVLAAVWPLYVLHSHLPLDTDVMITTETDQSCPEVTSPEARPPPLVQTAPGRGASTHLLAPGTTAARHALSFQYRKIDCPVTREAVPLHYGVTDTSVFDKRAPVDSIDDVMADIVQWLDRSGRDAVSPWPYSVVKSHWPQEWQSALMQPRCEVTVRYRAVRAGGGCSLEAALCPAALVCNAAPLPLTLRAHDAAPLCKLEPGTAISPPSVVLNKPFFISMEIGRETFVSGQLQVWAAELGRYGAPPPGRVAPDREAPFAIQCNNKVALLTMFYEIKEQINVFGVTPTYVILNRLETDILVSAVAVPNDVEKDVALRPKTFKCVSPTPEDSVHGTPVCRFWVQHRWRGSDPAELRAYLCIALPSDVGAAASSAAVGVSAVGAYPAHAPVPVRLGTAPLRRALALYDDNNVSRGVVVTQVRHEGRWLVSVAADPCPQFVVHNRTRISLAVAQPLRPADEPDTFNTQVTPECPGASWLCVVEPGACTHYSTPAHNARHPPPPNATRKHDACTEAMLTFAKYTADEGQPMWCSPVGAAPAGGEQLLHLFGGDSIKMRVRRHPHSTLVELQEVHQFDISASDIRRRLLGSLESENQLKTNGKSVMAESKQLERVGATEKLLTDSEVTVMKPQDEDTVMLLPQEGTLELQTSESQSSQVTATPNQPNYQPTGDPQPSNSERREAPNTLGGERTIYSVETLEGTHDRRRDGSVEKLEDPDREANPKDTTEVKAGGESGSSFVQLGVQGASLPDCSEPVSMETFAFADARAPDAEWCPRTSEAEGGVGWARCRERVRCSLGGAVVRLAGAPDEPPLLALHLGRAHLLLQHDDTGTRTSVSVAELQVDNLQYDSGQYDFAVVAATRGPRAPADARVPLWGMFGESVAPPPEDARLRLRTRHDKWTVAGHSYNELTEVELSVGPLALYIEDAYVSALARGMRRVLPAPLAAPLAAPDAAPLAEERALRSPLRLRALHVHPLDLTLTLHTAMRMYIALDQSPLRLGAFELRHVMTTTERLTHALTVHYLSAAILGAGWVVGGLELLGAPGALAARVSCASGGVRGVAAAAAAALLRSLSACAGSLARNLDLLAGDEEHARRAAAARRRPPHSLVAGLAAGITNFAINILGAVGGLAHHPLVGVAVGESEGGAMALRRGLLGALAKPLSATADLVAYAGHGLLRQTGWDPAPQPRECPPVEGGGEGVRGGWRRDCVRWTFRLADMTPLAGCEVLLDNAPLQLLLTHRFLVVADPESERIVEMLDYRSCSLVPYQGPVIELSVIQKRQSKMMESSRAVDEDDEYQISVAAMARVARYTGAEGARAVGGAGGGAAGGGEARVLSLVPPLGRSHALHAALATLIHHNSDSHLHLL